MTAPRITKTEAMNAAFLKLTILEPTAEPKTFEASLAQVTTKEETAGKEK